MTEQQEEFKYRVVFFHQPGCVACNAMKPIWADAAQELSEEYPHYRIGFGEWDVASDDWEFCDKIGCDGTPNFAIFSEESELLGLNVDGVLAKTQLKDFIIKNIEKDNS
jgi:thioredoxin-related protein